MARLMIPIDSLPSYRQRIGTSPDAYGAAIGEGISDAAKALGAIAVKEQQEQDEAVMSKAYADLANAKVALLADYSTKKGINALASRKDTEDAWQKKVAEISEALPAQHHRKRFAGMATQEGVGFNASVLRHQAAEGEVVKEESYKAAVSASLSDVAGGAAVGDQNRAASAMAMGKARVEKRAQELGIDPSLMLKGYTTEAHGSVLQELARRDDFVTAEKYLDTHRAEIDEKAFARLRDDVVAAGIRGKSRDIADRIVNTLKLDAPTPWDFPLSDALEAASNHEGLKSDPKLYDAVVERIQQAASQAQAARRINDEPKLGRIDQGIYTVKRIDKTSDDWLNLSDDGKAAAEAHLLAQQREDRREQNEFDQMAKYRYLAQPDAVQRDMDIDANPLTRGASHRQREELRMYQRDVLNKEGVPFDAFMARAADDAAGRKYNKKDTAGFMVVMRDEYRRWKTDRANQGQEPKAEDIERMFARAHGIVKTPGVLSDILTMVGADGAAASMRNEKEFWRTRSPDSAAVPAPLAPSIPDRDRAAIVDAFSQRKHRAPTEDEIQSLYRAARNAQ